VPEWLNGAVSKTVVVHWATVGSNPTLSASSTARPRRLFFFLGASGAMDRPVQGKDIHAAVSHRPVIKGRAGAAVPLRGLKADGS
jgi:hypothetical protein